jgi:hypothetical protein
MRIPGLERFNPLSRLKGKDPEQAPETAPVSASDSTPAKQTPEQLVDLVDKRFRWSQQAKEAMLKPWATSLAFYAGEHYRKWSKRQRKLVEPSKIPSWRVLLTDNQIPGVVEMAAAKLSQSRQLPRALSDTGDEEDELGAQAGTRVMSHWWRVDGMELKELEANIQRIILGDTFYHDYWDPSKLAKVAVTDPATGKMTSHRAPVGDVCVEVLSVFDVFPEPVERWSDVRWCIIARRKPLEWFEDTFGAQGAQVTADKGEHESVFNSLMPGSISKTTEEGNANSEEQSATLKVYYERPSNKYPRGRHIMTAGSVLLYHADELPLPHLEIPLAKKGFRYVPKRLWCAGMVEALIGQQRELNRVQNYTLENLRLHGRPRLLAPREAKIDPEALTSDPSEVLEYNASTSPPPGFMNPPSMPTWIQNLPEQIRAAMQQLSGQHEVSNARVPAGVTAASAIRLLQQQDDTRLAVPARMGKEALEIASRHVLATAAEFYREPRLIGVVGRKRTDAALALMGSDIGQRDVLVEITEGVADTDAVRTENFIGWWNTGIFQAAFAGQLPWEFAIGILHELGETWVVDAITGAREAQAEQEPQADPQAEALQAELALKQQELAGKMELETQKLELTKQKLMQELELKRQELGIKTEMQQQELGAKLQLQQADMAFQQQDANARRQQDFQLQREQGMRQAQQAAANARRQQMTAAQKPAAGGK